MSNWIEDDDEDDFLSPSFGKPASSSEATDQQSSADPAAELVDDQPAAGEWDPSHGFADGTQTVRLWADDNGDLAKVRVSLSWKDKLRGGSLQDAFNLALMYMNGWYTLGLQRGGQLTDGVDAVRTERQLTKEFIAEHRAAMTEVQLKLEALGPGENFEVQGKPVSASDFEGAVVVTLNEYGQAAQVFFDPQWLQTEANSAAIARAVMNCYRWARAKWTPPSYELTERGKLIQEQIRLNKELYAVMANGIAGF